jgi:hypothetical protein
VDLSVDEDEETPPLIKTKACDASQSGWRIGRFISRQGRPADDAKLRNDDRFSVRLALGYTHLGWHAHAVIWKTCYERLESP